MNSKLKKIEMTRKIGDLQKKRTIAQNTDPHTILGTLLQNKNK